LIVNFICNIENFLKCEDINYITVILKKEIILQLYKNNLLM